MTESTTHEDIVQIPGGRFMAACAVAAFGVFLLGRMNPFPAWVVAVEVLLTVLALFVLGSIKYRLDKNALTYGMVMVITATFWESWWRGSALRSDVAGGRWGDVWQFVHRNFLTLHGLEKLVHIDTMLFILGLTFFVAVIAQTRLLETVSFKVLGKFKGSVLPTVAILAAIVSFSSGILDGVSMIGLMIRVMVIILLLAKSEDSCVVYAVMVSTVTTTVCGMWLAYGEPPNLIMKTNLHPHLDNMFFLRYCAPMAVASYFVVLFNMRSRLKGSRVDTAALDVLDRNTADVRFLQASKHGEVLTSIEFAESRRERFGSFYDPVVRRLHGGEPLGEAMVNENMPEKDRRALLGEYLDEDWAEALDNYYAKSFEAGKGDVHAEIRAFESTLEKVRARRVLAQRIGAFAFVPFIGLLIAHAVNHDIPLFVASFAGFAAALPAIASLKKTRGLAMREGKHEYSEYLFLFPLFLSITLLQKTGFFSLLSEALHAGIETLGAPHVAFAQFAGTTFLSAMLDNNVVADFAGRALHGLDVRLMHLFAMAQIAGYATGGCWTHIGSAQSVVAYSFIKKEVNPRFTPFSWIKWMTPIILEIFVVGAAIIYFEGWLFAKIGIE